MLLAKLRLFWQRNWIWIVMVVGITVAFVLPIWYMAGMDEATRKYIVGINIGSLPWGILNTAIFVGFLWLMQNGGFTRFKKAKLKAELVDVRFSDVIGLTEAKREATEVVSLLKDRTRLKKIGGKILRGVLMVGPPGCGKTMLAKAIATEARIPFLTVAGSEFVEIFVGVGAARVRKLFKQARQYSRAYGAAIIFIDELDVVGRTRVFYDAFGGSSEGNSTLNQLLVEMDGLVEGDDHVVVIGATNAAEDVLDAALLRPGRFDRKIYVGRPNLEERQKIFDYYIKKVQYDPQMEVGRLARKAVYKTPADIENIIKEAALIATRNKKDVVGYKEISSAIERIELGVAHRLNMTDHEKEATAYHEAGHLIVLYLHHPTDDVFKASIIQRGGALGVVHPIPREELFTADRNAMLGDIKVYLAGYVAEKLKYNVTSDGVSADFTVAMNKAHTMVWRFGMGTNGYVGNFAAIPKEQISESLKEKLNLETQEILKICLKEVEDILKSEWTLVELFAKELISKEELDYDEIVSIFTAAGRQPPRLLHPPEGPITDLSLSQLPPGSS
ncbi:MAG: AAA family ATPase [Elusimicrobia bacterium]|nr:AAA family ATPase [Elusimicrobiota bacterium]